MSVLPPLRLGVNIDHVATLRNARAGGAPDPVRAALLAIEAGADGITAHLREDRRHIRDDDMKRLKAEISKPLNFEMAATDEMLRISLATKPHAVCLVPERREELTTEGGLDVVGQQNALAPFIAKLNDAGIRVSLFIAADPAQIEMAAKLRPSDRLRVMRALEVLAATGRSLSSFQGERQPGPLAGQKLLQIFLAPERELARAWIDRRFDAMMAAGALDEVSALRDRRLDPLLPVMRAHGVPGLIAYLDGQLSLAEAVVRGKADTRAYAKRQVTWFRHQMAGWHAVAPEAGLAFAQAELAPGG